MDKYYFGEAANSRHKYKQQIGDDGTPYVVPYVESINSDILFDNSGSLVNIPLEHHKIHEGKHFFRLHSKNIIGNGIYQFVHITNHCRPHIFFDIDYTDSPIQMEVWENIESYTGGEELIMFNNNRNSTEVSVSKIFQNITPTIGINAIKYIDKRIGGTTQGGGRSGSTRDENERVLKNNTTYLIRLTNLINQNNWVNMIWNLYQVTENGEF